MEDSSGPAVASDRALWRKLLGSAKLLRERLSADPKSSCQLKPGCCDADPAFKHSLEVWRGRWRAGRDASGELVVLVCVRALEAWDAGEELRKMPAESRPFFDACRLCACV